MKRRTRAESLEYRLHRLQCDLYDYQSYLEGKAEKAGNKDFEIAAEFVGEAAFELDVSQQKMKDVVIITNK